MRGHATCCRASGASYTGVHLGGNIGRSLLNELPNMRPAYAQVSYVVPEENWPRKGLQIEQILIEARDAILLGQADAKTGMDRAQTKVEQALR